MKDFKVILFFALFLSFGLFAFIQVEADENDNVWGWAWSENIGWISFNGVNYGVNIDPASGDFSGYAWSENIGWIKFDPAGPYPNPPINSADINFSTLVGNRGIFGVNSYASFKLKIVGIH